jgi:hypothetical protein
VPRGGHIRPCGCLNKLATVGDGDAPLQAARRGALIQLAVYYGGRFGHPGNAPGFGLIWGMFPLIHPSEVFGPPILRVGGWLCLHGLSFVQAITLEQREHKRLI